MNIQHWSPLGWTGWISLQSKGNLKSLLQHRSSKASILWCSAFFIVHLSHPYMTTGKITAFHISQGLSFLSHHSSQIWEKQERLRHTETKILLPLLKTPQMWLKIQCRIQGFIDIYTYTHPHTHPRTIAWRSEWNMYSLQTGSSLKREERMGQKCTCLFLLPSSHMSFLHLLGRMSEGVKKGFGHLTQRTDSSEKALMLRKGEGRGRRGWQRMRRLDGITDSMDMSLSKLWGWWWTGQPSVLQSMGSQGVKQDWATELNWTDSPVLA